MRKFNKSFLDKLNIKEINVFLEELGLHKFWFSVLATHLKNLNKDNFKYILKNKEFKNSKIFKIDFINNLTVGEISVLYEYSLAYVDHNKRKKEGQYFTPDDVAQFMAKKSNNFESDKIWIDPCSGIGNLSYWLIYYQKDPESFLKNNIFLVDCDELALFIARFILAINFQNKDEFLFNTIKTRFIKTDFLFGKQLPKYDYSILNPPYVVVPENKKFETSEAKDLYAYFLEKIIKTTKGFISITPQTFTNGQKFISLRKLILRNFNWCKVYCFDNVPDSIFRGIKFGSKNSNKANSTRAGIIIAQKNKNLNMFCITPMLRWRAHERKEMFLNADSFLTKITPCANTFVKLCKDLKPLYDVVKDQDKTLSDLISGKETKYKLLVPSTPRYFISALKSNVDRASFKILYFYNQREMNLAYLLINSSFMYWWWRINDGGMMLSNKTLKSLPIFRNFTISSELVKKLEKSEKTNKVVKLNAGKNIENVKHDKRLIADINKYFFPLYADKLILQHNNSIILYKWLNNK